MKLSLKKKMESKQKKKIVALKKKEHIKFIGSGSWLIDLVLTGKIGSAYPIGRVINVVGDYSVGKTLLACEMLNNLYYKEIYDLIQMYYDESEWAFDMDLALEFGMPVNEIIGLRERMPECKLKKADRFVPSKKVEDIYHNVKKIKDDKAKEDKKKKANRTSYDVITYITDSLDSLQDSSELKHLKDPKKGIEKQQHGGSRARILSQMFRDIIEDIYDTNMIWFVLSQVREAMNDPYRRFTRNGGKALDHHATQILWLYERGKLKASNDIITGIKVEVVVTKNKIGSRYNNAKFNILHGYGIDNIGSALDFMAEKKWAEAGRWYKLGEISKSKKDWIAEADDNPKIENFIKEQLQLCWNNMIDEAALEVQRKPKYGKKTNKSKSTS